jgi:LuxR family transcriptional regulator, activator of conjugal transfer of Ti plasmids
MKLIEHSLQEFIDAIQTADDEVSFERVADRLAQRLGFRWFAYLQISESAPALISSYPKSWTGRYFDLKYQQLDPVVQRARREHDIFSWNGSPSKPVGTREQRKFFDEAMTFGITSGVTVPIMCGFGRMAAFTLARDDRGILPRGLLPEAKEIIQLTGLYFHTHLMTKVKAAPAPPAAYDTKLTQRERQCLTWAAAGKTTADISTLVSIAPRTVVFHLENCRRKLAAASIAQCVAEALRRGLLS